MVDTFEDIASAVNLTLAEMNLRSLKHETIRGNIGSGVVNLMTRSLVDSGCNDTETAVSLFRKHYNHHLLDQTKLYPNGRAIVEHFSNKKHAILSNKPISFIEKILKALNFLSPFDSILGGDSLKEQKPNPIGLQFLMKKFNYTAKEVLMIGSIHQSHQQLLGMGIDAAVITACPRLAIEDGPTWPMPLLTIPETQIVLGRIKPEPYPFDEFA